MFASFVLNLITPQTFGAISSTTEKTAGNILVMDTQTQNDYRIAFAEPIRSAQRSFDSGESLLVQDTSIIGLKTPPIVKRQIVVSRMWLIVTAYSSTKDQTDSTPFITASNTPVRDGVVAANFLSFGSKMHLPTLFGEKTFVVEDRMNPRYPYRVDVWMKSREEALQFGVKIVPIEVVREI